MTTWRGTDPVAISIDDVQELDKAVAEISDPMLEPEDVKGAIEDLQAVTHKITGARPKDVPAFPDNYTGPKDVIYYS